MKALWWVSWYQPTEDARPLVYPPHEKILGWWNTGFRCEDDAHTLCALVQAETEEDAKAAIRLDWPEVTEWRFFEPSDGKLSDRFPLNPKWMPERFLAAGIAV
jgi:hypothetical protein